MNATLGVIDLGNEVVLRGLRAPGIATEVTRSEGGVAHILTAPMLGGRIIELDGVFTYAVADSVQDLINAGEAVTLSHDLFNGEVLVLSTDLSDLLTEFVNPGQTNLLTGTIQLIEVSS